MNWVCPLYWLCPVYRMIKCYELGVPLVLAVSCVPDDQMLWTGCAPCTGCVLCTGWSSAMNWVCPLYWLCPVQSDHVLTITIQLWCPQMIRGTFFIVTLRLLICYRADRHRNEKGKVYWKIEDEYCEKEKTLWPFKMKNSENAETLL